MPIEHLSDNELTQRCDGCTAIRTLEHTSLIAGIGGEGGSPHDPRVIALPACGACGAQEFLVRSVAGEPTPASPGSYGHLHGLLVDRLHDVLVGRKQRVRAARRSTVRLGPPVDDATLKRWFPEGLTLPPPETAAPGAAPDAPAPERSPR